jgi:hypothetical protein
VPDLDIDFQIAAANKWECSQRVSWRYAEADRHRLTENPALSTICGTGRHLDGKPPSPPRICVVSGQWSVLGPLPESSVGEKLTEVIDGRLESIVETDGWLPAQ